MHEIHATLVCLPGSGLLGPAIFTVKVRRLELLYGSVGTSVLWSIAKSAGGDNVLESKLAM